MLQSNLVTSLLSRVLEPAVFLARVNLLFQSEDSLGQLVGGHADSSQVTFLQEINIVGQRRDMGEFMRGRFFTS
jgi:hypothetical protein